MTYRISLQIIGELIETFLVDKFSDLELAGSIKTKEEQNINYIVVDLKSVKNWDNDPKKLVNEIRVYLSGLFKVKPLTMACMVKFKHLTLEVKTAKGEYDLSSNLQLFYLDKRIREHSSENNKFFRFIKSNWRNLLSGTLSTGLTVLAIAILRTNISIEKKIQDAGDQINLFSGIIGAFILSYLLTKTIAIRQEKLARVKAIRELSYKLTCFRKICYLLRINHNFWNDSKSYRYAKSIDRQIEYEDARFPDYENDVTYANYKALIITHEHETAVLMLYLQMFMFAGEEVENNADLGWGSYPPFIIYKHEEIEKYLSFLEFDEFWNAIDHSKISFNYSTSGFYIDPLLVAAKNYNLKGFEKPAFSEQLLLGIASDVQNKIIPELYHLSRLNEMKLPFVIRYIMGVTTAIMIFSVIYPIISALFFESFIPSFFNVFIILGLIIDIIIRLPHLLQIENTIDVPDDYR